MSLSPTLHCEVAAEAGDRILVGLEIIDPIAPGEDGPAVLARIPPRGRSGAVNGQVLDVVGAGEEHYPTICPVT